MAGIIAVVLGLGALVAFLPDPGGSGERDDGAVEADEEADAVDQLAGVCAGKPQPIRRAKPYRASPGFHQVEAIVVAPSDRTLGTGPDRIYLGDEDGWRSPEDREDLDPTTVEAVACYVATGSREVMTCKYDAFGTNNDDIYVPLATTWGRVVVRETRTGKEILRQDVPESPGAKCLGAASSSDTIQVEHPDGAIRSVLRRVNDGTDPTLPLVEQAGRVCDEDLARAAIPADRPIEAVAVLARTSATEPYAPLAPEHALALPAELRLVPVDQAGTVLCVHISDDRTQANGKAITLATGATAVIGRLQEGTDAQGRLALPWTTADGWGMGSGLAKPRQ